MNSQQHATDALQHPGATAGIDRLVVAIDGPSGTGKSTVARNVARALGLRYLDTGAMYRAVAVATCNAGLAVDDQDAVAQLAEGLRLHIGIDPDHPVVSVDDVNVNSVIREPWVSAEVSAVARNLGVRAVLVAAQRRIVAAAPAGIVLEGRDTTTVVAPDASVRILLTASEDIRLARRTHEVHGAVDAATLAATRDGVVRRDASDSAVVNFTDPAPGVIVLDTSDLDLDASIAAVLALIADVRSPRQAPAPAERRSVASL